ncbi:MAG TPA: hypothetical protein VHO70_02350 [Chitinispirillaceae bacterium]|nr:hypothetical protein [Chitinispirillaceae bacterium]
MKKIKNREELIQYYASLKKETLVLREDAGKYGNDSKQKLKP